MSVMVKGSGSTPFEKHTLWTNPSPSSSFSSQTVTLSDSINNYDYIGVSCKLWYTDGYEKIEALFPKSYMQSASGNNTQRPFVGYYGNSSSEVLARYITYVSNTKLTFSNCNKFGASGNLNNGTIPITIYGIKQSVS